MTTTEQVLRTLEEHRGTPQSGETIAEGLQVSRTAVWKAVKSLREAGYDICASPKKGYYLSDTSDMLSKEAVEAQLAQIWPKEERQGRSLQILVEEEVTSTNRELSALAIDGAASGTVLISGRQTSGKGHRDHHFSSPEGGLYMSILLRAEDLPYDRIAQMTASGALAVLRAVREVAGKALTIRWVNDLYLDKKKVCGILTEGASDLESNQLQWMVLGIGVNYRTKEEDYPLEIRSRITSLFPAGERGEKIPPRAKLAAQIIKELLQQPLDAPELMRQYAQDLDQKGEVVNVTPIRLGKEQLQESYPAILRGVDEQMRLLVDVEGEQQALRFGQVSIS